MKKAAFEKLWIMKKKNSVLKASVLSGYSRSSYYYRPKQQPVIRGSSSSRNRRSDSTETETEAAALEAIEKVALEYPSYGVRRITAMLRRSGMITSRKKV